MKLYRLKPLSSVLFFFFVMNALNVNAGYAYKNDKHRFVQTDAFKLYQKTFGKHELILLNNSIVSLKSRELNKVSTDKLASVDYINGVKDVSIFLSKNNLDKKVRDKDSITNVLIINTAKSKNTAIAISNIPFFTELKKAAFPSNEQGWTMFLEQNLNSELPGRNHAPVGQYSVTVSFLITKEGKVAEAKAMNDPGYGTAEEAVRVISASPDWIPASMFGKKVTYRQTQKVIFNITDDEDDDSSYTVSPNDLLIETRSYKIFERNPTAIIILNNTIVSRTDKEFDSLRIKDLAVADYISDSDKIKSLALSFPEKRDFVVDRKTLQAIFIYQVKNYYTEKKYDSISHTALFLNRFSQIPEYVYRDVLNIQTVKENDAAKIDSLPFIQSPTKAIFVSGGITWDKFLTTNLKADIPGMNGAPKGKYIVSISFVISKEGKVEDVRALNNPGFGTTEEAVRLISSSPNWKPATLFGKNAPFTQTQKIIFNVE